MPARCSGRRERAARCKGYVEGRRNLQRIVLNNVETRARKRINPAPYGGGKEAPIECTKDKLGDPVLGRTIGEGDRAWEFWLRLKGHVARGASRR